MMPQGAIGSDGLGMGQQQMVRHARRLEEVAMSGCQLAVQIAGYRDHPGLVERDPKRHAVV